MAGRCIYGGPSGVRANAPVVSPLAPETMSHEKRELMIRMLRSGLPAAQVSQISMLPLQQVLELQRAAETPPQEAAPPRRPTRPSTAPVGGRPAPSTQQPAHREQQFQPPRPSPYWINFPKHSQAPAEDPHAQDVEQAGDTAVVKGQEEERGDPEHEEIPQQQHQSQQRTALRRPQTASALVKTVRLAEPEDATPEEVPETHRPAPASADGPGFESARASEEPLAEEDHDSARTMWASEPRDDDDEATEAALQSLQSVRQQVYRRRIRTRESFRGTDRLNSGRCTREQFRKAVQNIIHPRKLIDPDWPIDVDALAEYFVAPGSEVHEPQVVDYVAFCHAVDEVFSTPFLEPRPLYPVPPPGAVVQDSSGFDARPTHEPERLEAVMTRFAHLVRIRGIDLPACFDGISRPLADKMVGRVRPEEFFRRCPLATSTPNHPAAFEREDMDLIIHRYTDELGFFRLFPFLQDMEVMHGPKVQEPLRSFTSGKLMTPRRLFSQEPSRGFPLAAPPPPSRPQSARPFVGIAGNGGERAPPVPELVVASSSSGRRPPARPQSARAATTGMRPQSARIYGYRPQSARPSEHHGSGRIAAGRSRSEAAERSAPPPRCDTVAYTEWKFDRGIPTPTIRHVPRQDVTARLRETVRDLGLTDLFTTFRGVDHLNTGCLPLTKARAALAVLKLDLNPQDWDDLLDRYATADGFFVYPDLCLDIEDGPPVDSGGQEIPNRAAAVGAGNGAAAARALAASGGSGSVIADGDTDAGCEEEYVDREFQTAGDSRSSTEVDRIVGKVAKQVRFTGMSIFDVFENYKKTYTPSSRPGLVNMMQYSRAVDMLGVELSYEERDVLYQAFVNPEAGHEFSYRRFRDAVDAAIAASPTSYLSSGAVPPKQPAPQRPRPGGQRFANPYYDKSGRVRSLYGAPSRPCSAPGAGRPTPPPQAQTLCRQAPRPPAMRVMGMAS